MKDSSVPPCLLLALALLFCHLQAYANGEAWERSLKSGEAAYRKKHYLEAERSFKTAVKEAEKFGGPNDPAVAQALTDLAMVYKRQGKYADAESQYKRCLSISEKAFGANHPDAVTHLTNLALLYSAQGKYSAAEPLFKRAIAIDEKELGRNHPIVDQDLENYAQLLRKMHRAAEVQNLEARLKAARSGHTK